MLLNTLLFTCNHRHKSGCIHLHFIVLLVFPSLVLKLVAVCLKQFEPRKVEAAEFGLKDFLLANWLF